MEMVTNQAAFETRDFYLACFLRCTGYDLIDLRAKADARFLSSVTDRRAATTCWRFWARGPLSAVPPLPFSATIKDMKALLHNA